MKLGEKLQQLRKKSGLSQEQLAARLSVSRQAVSKWELNETVPDTENVIQLARMFGVSCDYLLREEVDEPGARPVPVPGETHLDEQGWTRSATVLSLGLCVIGLLLALYGWFVSVSDLPIIIGLIVQVLGLVLFELAVPRMGARRFPARFHFYLTACWLVSPTLTVGLFWLGFWHFGLIWMDIGEVFVFSLILGGLTTAVLSIFRRRIANQT